MASSNIGLQSSVLCDSRQQCSVSAVLGLYAHLRERGGVRGDTDIHSFMSWFMSLPNVTLRHGRMEDPHDMLVPLFQSLLRSDDESRLPCRMDCEYMIAHEGLKSEFGT